MKPGAFSVVIPSYNEYESLPELIRRIRALYARAQIYVVDDSTEENYLRLRNNLTGIPGIRLIHRKKKLGRGSAVLVGLKAALTDPQAAYVFEMDADMSHNPEEMHLFLAKAQKHICIVGSRYTQASRIINWPLRRKILSILTNTVLRILLHVPVSDYTNGYRMYSRSAAEFLITHPLGETGFIALSESLVMLHRNGFAIQQVPITFTDRTYGTSSAGLAEHLNAVRGVMRILIRSYSEDPAVDVR